MKILLATGNEGKAVEVGRLLADIGIEIVSLKSIPDIGEIVEDGLTYEENALKKASESADRSGLITISDDSGIEVDALNGAPGIHSARFGGDERNAKEKNIKLLEMMKDVPPEKRGARFVCVAALASPKGEFPPMTFRGEYEGFITEEMAGDSGFGYDPIFLAPSFGQTFAQVGKEIKNRISHRAIAFAKVREYLKNNPLG
ncbi:MAG: RdgB/HAM1 family non-canonical purine NTP pyrophosphatase [Nitrospinota bacterium]|nr:RdgB/HAM1 family non-canonical purine NTP pyrophosphatase [Nitrospinota bacterium]